MDTQSTETNGSDVGRSSQPACYQPITDRKELEARAIIGGDLYKQGRITIAENLRLGIDAAHGEDTGPIEYEKNEDYAERVAEGWTDFR